MELTLRFTLNDKSFQSEDVRRAISHLNDTIKAVEAEQEPPVNGPPPTDKVAPFEIIKSIFDYLTLAPPVETKTPRPASSDDMITALKALGIKI